MSAQVSPIEKHFYEFLSGREGSCAQAEVRSAVAKALGKTSDQVQSLVEVAVGEGKKRGLLEVEDRERIEVRLSPNSSAPAGLPERRALNLVGSKAGDSISGRDLAGICKTEGIAAHEAIRWGAERGWFERRTVPDELDSRKNATALVLTTAGAAAYGHQDADERLIALLVKEARPVFLDELPSLGIDPADATIGLLLKRADLVRTKPRREAVLRLTREGRAFATESLEVGRAVNDYGRAEIEKWREVEFRPYDVTLEAAVLRPVKSHPLQRILDETRRAFLEMGFEEVCSPMVESSFWDFDALFQPQDHPARDMQDTFYCESPNRARLPGGEVVDRVRRTHENGGDTGSKGWGYQWDPVRAEQVVLRTHTTAATIRALAADPNPPRKVFCIGRVFRNETVSATKLPEFHQVDGIIIDDRATFATLLGTLKVFYAKMGFEQIRFKPAFFPYTEPSAEVYVYFQGLGRWVEMGGSGVFRPEVTLPVGCKVPVLAWGLGLERLAMYRYGIHDIRTLYQGDLDWIRGVPLCR